MLTGTPLLKLKVSDHAAMSRAEIEENQPSSGAAAMPALNPAIVGSIAGQNLNASAESNSLSAQSEQDVRLREYNVDWSRWIAQLADRWYAILMQYERHSPVRFNTPRATLIQFTCYNNGTLGNIELKQSSGSLGYDRLQVLALTQAVPLPPFPIGTKRSSITIIEGWESHFQRAGESDYIPGSFGKGFPTEKVREWERSP